MDERRFLLGERQKPPGMGWLLRDPVVIPDEVLENLLRGSRQVTCTPLRAPTDLGDDDFARIESESRKWFSHGRARFWICAEVKRAKSRRGPSKFIIRDLVLFSVGRLKHERVMG